MQELVPFNAQDCNYLIKKFRKDIETGQITISISPNYVYQLSSEDFEFLIKYRQSYEVLSTHQRLPTRLIQMLYESASSSQYRDKYEQSIILSNLAKNPATPTSILRLLFEASTTTYLHNTRDNLAGNPNTPTDLLELLGKDSSS